MKDPTTAFFDELGRRGHEPLVEKVSGTLRFDLVRGERIDHFFVTMKKGDIAISNQDAEADCVIRTEGSVFDGIVSGEVNAMAAMLRGTLAYEGDPQLLLLFQRLFPGPAASRGPGAPAGDERRPS
jgi:putative sterol carrier protein